MKSNTIRVEKKLILEFHLPGFRGASSSVDNESASSRMGMGLPEPRQLEHNHQREHWTIEVNAANARDTLAVLRELAAQIDIALSEGALR